MSEGLFWLRRIRALPSVVGCALVALVAPAWADVTVTNPLGSQSLPLWLVMPVLTSMCAVSATAFAISTVERSTLRWTLRLRAGLALVVAAPPLAATTVFVGDVVLVPVLVWTLLLTGLALASSSVVGALAWAPQVLASAVLLSVVTSGGRRLYDWQHETAIMAFATACFVLGCAMFARRGPADVGGGLRD